MDTFTPLDIDAFVKKYHIIPEKNIQPIQEGFENTFNTILLLLATITLLVIGLVLFIIIQKEIKLYSFLELDFVHA